MAVNPAPPLTPTPLLPASREKYGPILAGMTAGLIKDEAELESLWQKDLKLNPSENRDGQYTGWQTALKAAFACAEGQTPSKEKACSKS